jgi:RHS repeat-associated protein
MIMMIDSAKRVVPAVVCLLCLTLAGREGQAKEVPPGQVRYVVRLRDASTIPHPANVPRPNRPVRSNVVELGGVVEFERGDMQVVTVPEGAVEGLRRHPAVLYIQAVWDGSEESLRQAGGEDRGRLRTRPEAVETFPPPAGTGRWDSGTYSYDGAGNILAIGGDSYAYDTAGRLRTATVNGRTEDYRYDEYGNLVVNQMAGRSRTIPGANAETNRMEGVGYVYPITYDEAGNATSDGMRTYQYDALKMIVRVQGLSGLDKRNIYTPDEERIGVQESLDGWTWWTVRDFQQRVIRAYVGKTWASWAWVEDYMHANGRLVSGVRASLPERELTFRREYHTDHLGSIRLITTGNGCKVSGHEYYPFGEEQTPINQENQWEWRGYYRPSPMKFTGHERDFQGRWDEPTNENYIDYMHARVYNPMWGRFLSVDPGRDWDLRHPQSWNLYTYALNNPVNRVDPDGRRSYLVARNGPGGASHMFVVTHARYLGDPNAVVRSWGRSSEPGREGKLGRVGLRTTGMSAGTYADDVRTWKSFGKTDAASQKTAAQTDYTAIAATDGKVASVADAVKENNRYQLDGPNSNSAAQAVADRAQGSPVPTPDGYDTPTGVDETNKVKFDETKIKKDEINGVHRVHVPPI